MSTIANERVQLLTRKYGRGLWTASDAAHLDWLTARLDALVPHVSDADRARLAAIRAEAERESAEVELLLRTIGV